MMKTKIHSRQGRIKVGYLSHRDRFDGDHDLGIVGSALGRIECEFPFPLRIFKVLATNESLTAAAAPKSSLPNRLLHHKPCRSVRKLRQKWRKILCTCNWCAKTKPKITNDVNHGVSILLWL